jgi:hypothetical protein
MKPLFFKPFVATLLIVIVFVASWELYLRSQGYLISFNEDESLWANQRAQVYEPRNTTTVFVGASRIKFDLDIETWEKLTNDKVVQLALHGSNPRPFLVDLSNDESFRGKVIFDITETSVFNNAPHRMVSVNKRIDYFHKQTPAQKASFLVNKELESRFVFLDDNAFSLKSLLRGLGVKNRPGVQGDVLPFPTDFVTISVRRETNLTPRFIADTARQTKVKNVWKMVGLLSKKRGMGGDTLEGVLREIKAAVDKIRARGGDVLFVRPPSSGPVWEAEQVAFPRALYWDRLLAYTNSQGIHFADYPQMKKLVCPEWSHLKPSDGTIFTEQLVEALRAKNWFANHTSNH